MSSYELSFTKSIGGKSGKNECPPEISSKFPQISQALEGVYDDAGKCIISKATLMVFLDSGRVKFCISPQSIPRCLFGCVPEGSEIISGIESELAAGHFEWKSKRGAK